MQATSSRGQAPRKPDFSAFLGASPRFRPRFGPRRRPSPCRRRLKRIHIRFIFLFLKCGMMHLSTREALAERTTNGKTGKDQEIEQRNRAIPPNVAHERQAFPVCEGEDQDAARGRAEARGGVLGRRTRGVCRDGQPLPHSLQGSARRGETDRG